MEPVEWLRSLNTEAVEAIEKKYNAPGLISEFINEIEKTGYNNCN